MNKTFLCLHVFRNIGSETCVEYSYTVYSCQKIILEMGSRESKSIKINHKMKILTVAFMLLFNYLDTLPKLYPDI